MANENLARIRKYEAIKTEKQGQKLAIKNGWNVEDARAYQGSWVEHFHKTAQVLRDYLIYQKKKAYGMAK